MLDTPPPTVKLVRRTAAAGMTGAPPFFKASNALTQCPMHLHSIVVQFQV